LRAECAQLRMERDLLKHDMCGDLLRSVADNGECC
jgi:hypothetical protein